MEVKIEALRALGEKYGLHPLALEDDEIAERRARGIALTGPERAVLLASAALPQAYLPYADLWAPYDDAATLDLLRHGNYDTVTGDEAALRFLIDNGFIAANVTLVHQYFAVMLAVVAALACLRAVEAGYQAGVWDESYGRWYGIARGWYSPTATTVPVRVRNDLCRLPASITVPTRSCR